MTERGSGRRLCALLLAGALLTLVAPGCAKLKSAVSGARLAPVAAVPAPKLPPWIVHISPTGNKVSTLAQVRIIFKNALIPVEAIESPDQQAKLQLFEIAPQLPGHFRFLTPRMVGFQADKAVPKAARVRITLKAGLQDLKNNALSNDLSWTFTTDRIQISNLPGSLDQSNSEASPGPTDINPTLTATASTELDVSSLESHTLLVPETTRDKVAVRVALQKMPSPPPGGGRTEDQPQNTFDESTRSWVYTINPSRTLDKATHYRLVISPGVLPARGNLPSDESFSGKFGTYAPLAFKGLNMVSVPDAGGPTARFATGQAALTFNNPLDGATIQKNLTVSPAIKDTTGLVQFSDGDDAIRLNPELLDPDTAYTLTVGADLKDKFGQTLGQSRTATFNTGNVAADLWAPGGLNIFPAGTNLQLDISAVNLPNKQYHAAYRIMQPADLVYTDTADPGEAGYDVVPPMTTWSSSSIAQPKNQTTFVHVPLRQQLGGPTGMLAYGVSARTYQFEWQGAMKWREPVYYGLVQLTNLGIFAQWFPNSGLVRVHRLSDGSPVRGAGIEIYPSRLSSANRPAVSPCATATTDSSGVAVFTSAAIAPCVRSGSYADEAPALLAIAREANDWAYVRTEPYSGAYGYGIDGGWPSATRTSRGTVFSDRQLYQPGESGWLVIEAYYLDGDTIVQDKNASYSVTLENPDGSKSPLGKYETNAFGSISFPFKLKPNQPLGYYGIHAKNARGAEMAGQFQVAEFKPPNFKVELTLDKEFAVSGDTVNAKGQSNYLFGSPVEGGKASYYVTRQQTSFVPKGWGDFAFGRQWYWPEQPPSVPSDVLQSKNTLGADGSSAQAVKVGDDLPYAMTYRVDVQTTDVSNLSVADSKSFTALPSDKLIGLQSDWVADVGKPFKIQVIVTDPKGAGRERERVHLELQSMTYSAATRVIAGGEQQRNQVQYATVDQADIASSAQPQTATLTPPKAGPYRIRANFAGAKDDVTASDTQVWVTGPQAVNWGSENPSQLQVKLDKATYKPGEMATALIQSPYASAELYFAVVRHDVMYRSVIHTSGGAPQIKFRVTPDMMPNAAVEAVLVRQGPALSKLQPGSLDSLSRIGFAPFHINVDSKRLKLQIAPRSAKAEPGGKQIVQLALRDAKGAPIRGQFTVMVVNEAVLQLTGYRPPNLVDTIYADRSIDTRFGDNRPSVVLAPIASPVQKGWGYGGGFLPGAASTRIRKNFRPLAYFNGAVVTDASGHAEISFPLPDDLTTWRVLAVATASAPGDDLTFGNGDTTFITTKPLVTNPVLPQFARPGDQFDGGISVTNNSGLGGTLSISGSSAGWRAVRAGQMVIGGLRFWSNGQPADTAHIDTSAPETATQAYRFSMKAGSVGPSQVRFDTRLGSASDAFEVAFNVEQPQLTEFIVDTGVTDTRVSIPLNVDQNVSNDAGGLHVQIASSIIPDIATPTRDMLAPSELPFLEPLASHLAVIADSKALIDMLDAHASAPNAAAAAAQHDRVLSALAADDITNLAKLQKPDGGFAAWPRSKTSDRFVTPYAARSLARARAAGLPVDAGVLSRVKSYLERLLANPTSEFSCISKWCSNYLRLQALIALSDLGETRNDFLSDIYDGRDDFDIVTRLQLADYLLTVSGWRGQADAMASKFEQDVYETGRYATLNYPEEWGWLASPSAARAETLRLFLARHAGAERLDKLVRSLLALRTKGRWPTTYDTASALGALVDYLRAQPAPPNFSAEVQLAGKMLLQTQFAGYTHPTDDVQVPMSGLPRGQSALELRKNGPGRLHYVVSYGYLLSTNQPGALQGLRVTREIRPANQAGVAASMGIAAPDKPTTLQAGQVWDVGLQVITDHPVDHLVVTDPLPAGLEAVDASFQTATQYFQARGDSWEIDYQQIYRDKVVAFAGRLEAGVYDIHYLVRSVTPGTFTWPGAQAQLEYAPEEFGRTASTTLVVSSP